MVEPSLIALDWGTSSLRAYLLGADGATVLDSRAEPWGIMQMPAADFGTTFEEVTGAWRARWPALASIACGMIGSNRGWVTVPYCPCPAGEGELAATLAPLRGGALHIVAGIAQTGDSPDVMRGEETQIIGALDVHPEFAAESLLVLPGTHSKWVRVLEGKVRNFATYMTGELFTVLRDHSILGRPPKDAHHEPDVVAADAAFARGVLAARASANGIAPLLFSARALVLAERLEPETSLDYVSGLLIGDELRCGLMGGVHPSALIGDTALCRRYVIALGLFGVNDIPVVDGSAARGLWRIARHARLAIANEHT